MAASIGFWICLLLSACGYAAATLAGSYVENQHLAAQQAAGADQLRHLAEQVGRYEDYVRRLASPPVAETGQPQMASSIPLEGDLQFHLDRPLSGPSNAAQVEIPAWIDLLSRSAAARGLLLVVSAGLLLAAFTLCVASPTARDSGPPARAGLRRTMLRGLYQAATRYRSQQAPGSHSRMHSAGRSIGARS